MHSHKAYNILCIIIIINYLFNNSINTIEFQITPIFVATYRKAQNPVDWKKAGNIQFASPKHKKKTSANFHKVSKI